MATEALINLRVSAKLREEFRIAAELEGLDMSAMLRHFMVRSVRKAKKREPEAFAAKGQQ